uniref:Uncharacterized protein n=1 Tax=Anopheles coluzzii TaxID=1518534 RepID=A0A8W7Q158_ANOCL
MNTFQAPVPWHDILTLWHGCPVLAAAAKRFRLASSFTSAMYVSEFSGFGRRFPDDSGRFRAIPDDSGRFRAIPGDSGRFRAIPSDSGRFRAIPDDSRRFRKVPTTPHDSDDSDDSRRFRTIPGGSGLSD